MIAVGIKVVENGMAVGMRKIVTIGVLTLLIIGGGPVRAAEKQGAGVLDVDGRRWFGRVSALSDVAVTLGGETPTELETANILRLEFGNRRIRPLAGRAVLFLANGDRLVADPISMDDEAVLVHWSRAASRMADSPESALTEPAQKMAIPTETIRGILLAVPATTIARDSIVHALLNRSAKSDAVFLDSRVIFRHFGLDVSREERFQSDLLGGNRIDDPWLSAFTGAAAAVDGVILGGHSLVAGGLMALSDAAWSEYERAGGTSSRAVRGGRPASGSPGPGA